MKLRTTIMFGLLTLLAVPMVNAAEHSTCSGPYCCDSNPMCMDAPGACKCRTETESVKISKATPQPGNKQKH